MYYIYILMCISNIYIYIPEPCFVKFSGECQHPVHLHGRQGLHAAGQRQGSAVHHIRVRETSSEPLPVLFVRASKSCETATKK